VGAVPSTSSVAPRVAVTMQNVGHYPKFRLDYA
jgi:hypothetical protein